MAYIATSELKKLSSQELLVKAATRSDIASYLRKEMAQRLASGTIEAFNPKEESRPQDQGTMPRPVRRGAQDVSIEERQVILESGWNFSGCHLGERSTRAFLKHNLSTPWSELEPNAQRFMRAIRDKFLGWYNGQKKFRPADGGGR